jgi:uncharacterized protein (DUF2147 family)
VEKPAVTRDLVFRLRKVSTFLLPQKPLWVDLGAGGRFRFKGRGTQMLRKTLFATATVFAFGLTAAFAAEPIEGNWKTQSGETAAISNCGGAFCVTLKTGKHAGKQIGKMSGTGAKYKGSITDPANDKTYTGSASITGTSMKMKGCVLSILCKTQTWTKM